MSSIISLSLSMIFSAILLELKNTNINMYDV